MSNWSSPGHYMLYNIKRLIRSALDSESAISLKCSFVYVITKFSRKIDNHLVIHSSNKKNVPKSMVFQNSVTFTCVVKDHFLQIQSHDENYVFK